MVWPPICVAAAPVDAVTKTRRPTRFAARMASLSAKDLPVPCVFHCLFGHERRFGVHNLLALAPRLAATYIARISGKACGRALNSERDAGLEPRIR